MGTIATHNGKVKAEAAELLQHPRILLALNARTYDRLRKVAESTGPLIGADYHTVNAARERLQMVGGVA